MLSSKTLNNLAAMSGAFLLGERPKYSSEVMAELWQQVDAAQKEAERIAKEDAPNPAEHDKP